ncbi:glutaredoxin domain-containing protein [Sarocladium implicatum]|nr:glutaredoxin domain-containing protein [Sarocladium implicatum]
MAILTEIGSKAHLRAHAAGIAPSTVLLTYYYSSEDKSCEVITAVVREIAAEYESDSTDKLLSIALVDVITAKCAETKSEKYGVPVVPYLLFTLNGKIRQAMSSFEAAKLRNAISSQLTSATASKSTETAGGVIPVNEFNDEPLHDRLVKLTRYAPVVLFMKGNHVSPACRFSGKMVKLLDEHKVRYVSYNILADDNVRQGLKDFGNWPTFPQLWVDGQMVGGLDVISDELNANPYFLRPNPRTMRLETAAVPAS